MYMHDARMPCCQTLFQLNFCTMPLSAHYMYNVLRFTLMLYHYPSNRSFYSQSSGFPLMNSCLLQRLEDQGAFGPGRGMGMEVCGHNIDAVGDDVTQAAGRV